MASQVSQSDWSNVCFLKYFDGIFVVTRKEMHKVFSLLYKGGNKYVGDYLDELPRDTKRSLRLGSIEKKDLEDKVSPENFDIPFIYKCLQFTCGLAPNNESIWHAPTNLQEKQSLEHSLYLLKERRNKLCHEPWSLKQMTAEDLDNHFDELSKLCEVILLKGGQKAGKSASELNDLVSMMKQAFDDIKAKPAVSGMTSKKFGGMAKIEMKDNHTPSPVGGNFVYPVLQNEGEDGTYRRNLQDFPLWQCGSGSYPKTIILSGETGTGKTALCGHLYDSWISNKRYISHLEDFDLVVPVKCCSVSTPDILDFLRGFMKDTHALCTRDEIFAFLKSLNILWVFDGFEEATKNAIELLKQIPQYQGSTSGLILVTTQPQRLQDLINKIIITTETTIVAQLLGFSVESVKQFLTNVLSGKGGNFYQDVKDLGKDVLQELRVPLKLKLMVELWKDGKLRKESGASVYFLYKSIMEAHKEKITEKIKTETKLEDEEIEDRVSSWANTLCKAAFDMMINNQFVKIDRKYQEKLENGAKSLIHSKDCLSLYLQRESSSENNSYSFIHGTQQIYLAAQYVFCEIQEKGSVPQKLKQLINIEPSIQNRQSDYILHSMLLQVVSSVAQQKNVKSNIAKDLVQLLSTFRNYFNAFEVIRHAAYDSVFTEEVSKYSGRTWEIIDHDIKCALVMLQHATPAVIGILIEKDPNDVQELSLLLKRISERDIELELFLILHFISNGISDDSNNYLRHICSNDVKCHLKAFTGCLSINSTKNLTKMRELKVMELKVTSNEILHQILIKLKFLKNLEILNLHFLMPVVTVPSSHFFDVRINHLQIDLPLLDESKVNETADAISNISNHYERIILRDISASSVVQFIQRLQERNVRVNEIVRKMSCHHFNMSGFFEINYGCVPLSQPIEVFHDQWENTRLETYEDDLGIRRLRLITSGIPDYRVKYVDVRSPANVKIIDFA